MVCGGETAGLWEEGEDEMGAGGKDHGRGDCDGTGEGDVGGGCEGAVDVVVCEYSVGTVVPEGERGEDETSRSDREFVLLRQFIHTENSDDILKRLVILEDLLDGGGDLVMFLSDLENQKGSIEYMTSS